MTLQFSLGGGFEKRVIASNRDEFLARSTENAKWHSFGKEKEKEENNVISGLDLIGGGTWLGYTKRLNRFGFLTNLSNITPPMQKKSKWISREEYLQEIKDNSALDLMDGYNLVIGEIQKNGEEVIMDSFCNRQTHHNEIQINSNFYQKSRVEEYKENGISNGIKSDEEENEWIKVKLGKDLLTKRMIKESEESNQEKLIEDLFDILSQTDPNDEALPKNILIRPHHRLNEPSDIPNRQTWYGTKTQTLVLVSRNKKVTFIERDAYAIIDSMDHLGLPVWLGDDRKSWRRFEFDIA
ncbi:uncharacterized protein MELLADRAFT_61092 [Melampsora larici-populina 98AG31]|uniref:Uncharacterized protein n=1 Tax=Melampsora larici-populina (strain 98AG31 / pathotype 3-4-7) TaxID=747676 RepID=F4RDK3_MELLP|nr:uncharacterized protein MELLADRAFT_61092 [Melampsora larici-populina 98AG31]EGG09418.1 hypothetical protein MELLADRAFT_61092 [Melampsora larici-populina 98AG31]